MVISTSYNLAMHNRLLRGTEAVDCRKKKVDIIQPMMTRLFHDHLLNHPDRIVGLWQPIRNQLVRPKAFE